MSRNRVALATAWLALIVSAGCGSGGSQSGALRAVGQSNRGKNGISRQVRPDVPYAFFIPPVCTQTGEPVTIDRVKPWNPRAGIHIVDWGTRVDRPGESAAHDPNDGAIGTVTSLGGGFDAGPVTVKCSDTVDSQEFHISVMSTTTNSKMDGVTVDYDGGHVLHEQIAVALCPSLNDCKSLS